MVVLLIWIYIWYFDFVIRCGPYPQVPVDFLKKKNQVKSPSPESRTPNSVRIRRSDRTGIRGVTGLALTYLPFALSK